MNNLLSLVPPLDLPVPFESPVRSTPSEVFLSSFTYKTVPLQSVGSFSPLYIKISFISRGTGKVSRFSDMIVTGFLIQFFYFGKLYTNRKIIKSKNITQIFFFKDFLPLVKGSE